MVTVTEKPLTFTWTSVMMTTSKRMERGKKESERERGGWAGEKRRDLVINVIMVGWI